VKALTHPVSVVRIRAAFGLGMAGPAAATAVPQLKELTTSDPVVRVRRVSQWAMEQIATPNSVSDPDLVLFEGLQDDDIAVRLEAIQRLGASRPFEAKAIPQLIRMLADSVEIIRNAAIIALVQKGSVAVPSLTLALQSRNPDIRNGAMLALSLRRDF
jgi:HEAT repeat protein